jgi:microcystin-dependent protein
LQGAVPLGQGQGPGLTSRFLGESGGEASVTLLQTEIAAHTHFFQGVNAPASSNAAPGNLLASNRSLEPFGTPATGSQLNPAAVAFAGGSQPHNNLQPYLTVTFIIALAGVFPARN